MPALAPDFCTNDVHRAVVASRHIRGVSCTDNIHRRASTLDFERAKFVNNRVVARTIKLKQPWRLRDRFRPNCFSMRIIKTGAGTEPVANASAKALAG